MSRSASDDEADMSPTEEVSVVSSAASSSRRVDEEEDGNGEATFGDLQMGGGGFLTKQGGRIKTWKRRFFLVRKKQLYYFRSEGDSETLARAKGWIPLLDAKVCLLSTNVHDREFAFGLTPVAGERTYSIVARSASERDAWIHHLCYHGARRLRRTLSHLEELVEHKDAKDLRHEERRRSRSRSRSRKRERKEEPRRLGYGERLDEGSTREGWLLKRGEIFNRWRVRYFVLSGSMLRYYKKKVAGAAPKGEVYLDGAEIIREDAAQHSKENVFSVATRDGSRRLFLGAATSDELEAWTSTVAAVVERLAPPPPPPDADYSDGEAATPRAPPPPPAPVDAREEEETLARLKPEDEAAAAGGAAAGAAAAGEAAAGAAAGEDDDEEDDDDGLAEDTLNEIRASLKQGEAEEAASRAAAAGAEASTEPGAAAAAGRGRRNSVLDLRGRMLRALDGDKEAFVAFRKESMNMVNGIITPLEYLRIFFRTFPRSSALDLFPDLVSAVPDRRLRRRLRVLYHRLMRKLNEALEQHGGPGGAGASSDED